MMLLHSRYWAMVISFVFSTLFLLAYFYHTQQSTPLKPTYSDPIPAPDLTLPRRPIYKPTSSAKAIPIVDNFPLAAIAQSAADLPPLPSWNVPMSPHAKESTPLFIGFTRNWRLLQQVVVSYITSGWPAEDIYVVENTGVMESNALGLLSLQNPFFLNHTRLEMLGVNILVTPTLLTFAQLQNYYIYTATEKSWAYYFWSHMDVVAVSSESALRFPPSGSAPSPPLAPSSPDKWQSRTLYANCLSSLRDITSPDPATGTSRKWASVFFSYDRLALVNVAAYKSIGGWDTMIPFYSTDCDMHSRITFAKYEILEYPAGLIYDVASSLDDLAVLYRQASGPKGDIGGPQWVDPNNLEAQQVTEANVAQVEVSATTTAPDIREAKLVSMETTDGENSIKTAEDAAWKIADLFSQHINSSSLPRTRPASQQKPSPNLWKLDTPSSSTYDSMLTVLDRMQNSKSASKLGRNTWQVRQGGVKGEPFYRDSAGFERGIQMTIDHGHAVFAEKWGHRDCDLPDVGLTADDAWRVEHDWE